MHIAHSTMKCQIQNVNRINDDRFIIFRLSQFIYFIPKETKRNEEETPNNFYGACDEEKMV